MSAGFATKSHEFTDDDILPMAKIYLEEKYKVLGKPIEHITEKDVARIYWFMRMYWFVSINIY